jgi:gas vesicle protein
MADGYDGFDKSLEYREGGGGSFVMGLLTGTVLGAGLGMLFAPKSGPELRRDLSDQANTMANQASEGYRRASESASQWAEKGREVYSKASEAVSKGAQEAQKYVRDTANTYGSETTGSSTESSGSSGSSYSGTGTTSPGSSSRRS